MIDGTWLVLRAADLMLALQAAGIAIFAAAYGSRLSSARVAVAAAGVRCALAALGVLVAEVLFEPSHLAGDWEADLTATRLALASPAGAALLSRVAGAACIACGLHASGAPRRSLALAGAVAIVGSFALTGHTAVHERRLWLAPLLILHVSIVAFWFGSLWPLRLVLRLEPPATAAAVLTRFSVAAVWLVPLIAVAGAGMALLLLPDVAALRQPYGLALLTKASLFALLMALAAMNRLQLVPALAGTRAPEPLRRSIALEYVLICIVLAVTALMTGRYSPEG
jgi:putative copper export protein